MTRKLARAQSPKKEVKPRRYKDGKRVETAVVVVDGLLCRVDIYFRHLADRSVLTAWCEEHQVEASATDIGKVREAIVSKIRERLTITWEPWMVIRVTERCNEQGGPIEWDRDGLSLELEARVDLYDFGICSADGQKYHRRRTWRAPTPGRRAGYWSDESHFSPGWIEPSPRHESSHNMGMGAGRSFSTTAVIRETPEARAAIERIRLGMHQIGIELGEILSQSNITATIGRLSSGPLALALSAPSAPEPEGEVCACGHTIEQHSDAKESQERWVASAACSECRCSAYAPSPAPPEGGACVCGHSVEEHRDDAHPGSSSCAECDCVAYEREEGS